MSSPTFSCNYLLKCEDVEFGNFKSPPPTTTVLLLYLSMFSSQILLFYNIVKAYEFLNWTFKISGILSCISSFSKSNRYSHTYIVVNTIALMMSRRGACLTLFTVLVPFLSTSQMMMWVIGCLWFLEFACSLSHSLKQGSRYNRIGSSVSVNIVLHGGRRSAELLIQLRRGRSYLALL